MYSFGAAIPIAHGDRDSSNEDGRDNVRSTAKSGSYCTKKTTHLNKTLAMRMLQNPLHKASGAGSMKVNQP